MLRKGSTLCLATAALLLVCNSPLPGATDPLSHPAARYNAKIPSLVEAWLENAWEGELEDEDRWTELLFALEMLRDVFPSGRPRLSFQMIHTSRETLDRVLPGHGKSAMAAVHEAMEAIEEAGFFERMDALTSARRAVPPVELPLILEQGRVDRDPYSRLALKRRAADALAARLHLDAAAGDYESAIARFEAMLALARLSGHHPLWKGYETSGEIVSSAFTRIIEDLFTADMESRHYIAIMQALDRQPFSGLLTLALEAERIAALQLVEHVHRTGRLPQDLRGRELPETLGNDELRDHQIAFVHRFYNRLIDASRLPAWEMLPAFESRDFPPRHYPALHALRYNSDVRVDTHLLIQTCLDGLRLMCALELMRIEAGAYPGALDELVPRYLDAPPPDPFTGEPFRYRLFENSEDPFDRAYLLYSLGYDRIDYGGRAGPPSSFPINAWRVGRDFVINRVPGDFEADGERAGPQLEPLPESVAKYNRKVPALVQKHLETAWGEELEPENAWPLLIETVEMVRDPFPTDSRNTFDVLLLSDDVLANRFPDGGIDEARRAVIEVLQRLERERFFDRAAALARARRFVPHAEKGLIVDWDLPAPPGGLLDHTPRTSLVRRAARAASAQMHLAARARDYDTAVSLFESMLALARAGGHYPAIRGLSVECSITVSASTRLHEELLTRDLQPHHYRNILAAMARQQQNGLLALTYDGDRLATLQVIEHLYVTGYIPPMRKPTYRADALRNAALRDEQLAFVKTHAPAVTAAARLPMWEALPALREAQPEVPEHLFLVQRSFHSIADYARLRAHRDAVFDGTRTIVALEWMRSQTGSYPESLDELVPRYIDALPPDPYTGEPFRYRRFEQGQDPHGRGYLLYSVGYNRIDNGGQPHERWPDFASSPNATGVDYIINDHRVAFRKHW